jgi:exodeoxyribonuclease V alpha subunit
MLDVPLAFSLLQAIPNKASLILVGDIDQLPSVGPGNVLRDIIDSGVAKVIRLTQIFRQHHASQIIVNAHRVNEGHMTENTPGQAPIVAPEEVEFQNEDTPPTPSVASSPVRKLTSSTDFHMLPVDSPEEAVKRIVSLCSREIPDVYNFDPIDDIQIMAPMHRGVCGVENLNRELQKALNPKKDTEFRLRREGETPEIERFGRLYRVGDKVMQIKNNYDKDVFNGDLGRILSISRENQKVMIKVDEREIEYDFSDLDELLPAYAISIHKSQGSEYPVVVIPILTQHYVMLQRNLIYTGITRGKKLVILVGSAKALTIAVHNNKTSQRYGMLKTRLM